MPVVLIPMYYTEIQPIEPIQIYIIIVLIIIIYLMIRLFDKIK